MTLDDFLLEAEDKMSKTEQVVVNEFSGVRTGKASPALVENILAEVYGSQMRIRELAGITTPEPRPGTSTRCTRSRKPFSRATSGSPRQSKAKRSASFFPN